MKRMTLSALLLVSLVAGSIVFAQSQTSQKPKEQSSPPMMMCPMMSKTEGQAAMANMQGMMQGMPQRMAGMFSPSAEEISARLSEKKAELGLSDAQVKQVAELIASSEQERIKDKMKSMMNQMQAGMQAGMKCPCMQGATK